MVRLQPNGRWGFLSAAIIAVALAKDSNAQCVMPDNFQGNCCALTIPTLPPFPGGSIPGGTICWQGCVPSPVRDAKVTWTTPAPITCTQFVSTLSIFDANSGLPILSGPMILDYTRTWDEQAPSGQMYQVWRLTVKADLSVVPAGVVWFCEAPSCIQPLGPHSTAFYYGYMDFTLQCGTVGPFDNALVLQHSSDFFIHRPGFSSTPGNFHPTQSYAIVAPHSAAQPFVPQNAPAPGGAMFGDAMRDVSNASIPFCPDSDRLQSTQFNVLGGACLSILTTFPKQHWLRQSIGTGNCVDPIGLNGGYQSLNIGFPTLPWFHVVTTAIGNWTNPAVYPGVERAYVDEGLFIHTQVCFGQWLDVKYGATTRGGWSVVHPVLITTFTDLTDNYSAPLFGPYTFPIYGSLMPSDRLVYTLGP